MSFWPHIEQFRRAGGTPPAITSLNYTQGDTAGGGQAIVITGTNLSGATNVKIGGNNVSPSSSTSTTCTFTLPAHAAGVVTDVAVTTPGGTSATTSFEYWSPASASSATPTHRWTAAGAPTSGGNATGLTDSIGSMNQSVTAGTATYNATDAAFGNQPTVSGTFGMTHTATATIASPVSIFMVCKPTNATAILSGSSASPYDLIWCNYANGLQTYSNGGFLDSVSTITGSAQALFVTDSGSGLSEYINNFATADVSGAAVWGTVTSVDIATGSAGVANMTGTFAEAAIFSGVVSSGERTKLRSYVSQKYGF